MAKKISQLTQATQVKSDDVTVIVQDGETKKLPLNMMVTKQDIENKKVAGLAKLDEIEATYENDTYTPTITVKNKSSNFLKLNIQSLTPHFAMPAITSYSSPSIHK